jgi:integrase
MTPVRVHDRRLRRGFLCQRNHEREAAVLARQPHETPYPAGCKSHRAFTNETAGTLSATPFGTLLKANGEDVKTVQELLRHASSRITLETYQQSVSEEKREAQDRVMGMLLATNEKDAEGSNPSAPLETYRNQLSKP